MTEYTSITSPPMSEAEKERYRRFVASLPCAFCEIEGYSQCAHSNSHWHGKGRGIKSHDLATAPLCGPRPDMPGCHSMYDSSRIDQDEFDSFIVQTIISAANAGVLKVK